MFAKPKTATRVPKGRSHERPTNASLSTHLYNGATQEAEEENDALDQSIMQSLIDRHFRSPELRQLAQRVILSTHTTKSNHGSSRATQHLQQSLHNQRLSAPKTRRDPSIPKTAPRKQRKTQQVKKVEPGMNLLPPKRRIRNSQLNRKRVEGKPQPSKDDTHASSKPNGMKTISMKDYADPSKVEEMKRKLDALSATMLTREIIPTTGANLESRYDQQQSENSIATESLTLNPALNQQESDDDDWGDFGDGEEMQPVACLETLPSSNNDHVLPQDDGPILLEFRSTEALENKMQVGKMVFDSLNQSWVNTEMEEEEDIMAGFSSSDEDEPQPPVIVDAGKHNMGKHQRTMSVKQVEDTFVTEALAQMNDFVKEHQECENNHKGPEYMSDPFSDPVLNDDWLKRMAHIGLVRTSLQLASKSKDW